MRKAKIVCTIGPASEKPEMLDRLIESGMDVVRLNFSHGTHDSHGRAIKAVREAANRRRATVAIMQDLQGPRIRVGALPASGVDVAPDQRVRLVLDQRQPSVQAGDVPVAYAGLARDVRPGARILIDDGQIELVVERVGGTVVECTVRIGGRITSHKGINLPGTAISEPTLTEKDRDDLRFGLAQKVDYVALSFVRSPKDIVVARELITASGGDVPVIAKIERREAVDSLDAILDEADGVMIARGDLGVEMGPEAVPLLQKRIIVEANRRRRLVITATQMLESMTQRPGPTRAEASDVANAVFDGTDAVMLSAETAAGRYPMEAVQVMDRIVRAAEEGMDAGSLTWRPHQADPASGPASFPEAICAAAASAASATGAGAIVAFSESGTTGRLLSKQRPGARIIAFTPSESVRRRMALYWGVIPLAMSRIDRMDERVLEVDRQLKEGKWAATGDRIVILSGTLTGQPGGTNVMKLHKVA
ncbi:MAG TPA: pyruvate kinase [Nitrospiraceae bacterium]|jgi:pyruvate kinase|nr:pyruvate kinase [Nitrospiraceae bacterium]